jgi:hypothetical protein
VEGVPKWDGLTGKVNLSTQLCLISLHSSSNEN